MWHDIFTYMYKCSDYTYTLEIYSNNSLALSGVFSPLKSSKKYTHNKVQNHWASWYIDPVSWKHKNGCYITRRFHKFSCIFSWACVCLFVSMEYLPSVYPSPGNNSARRRAPDCCFCVNEIRQEKNFSRVLCVQLRNEVADTPNWVNVTPNETTTEWQKKLKRLRTFMWMGSN